ncbi:MAG: HAD hydrolase-like protein [Bacilli bacterium]|jgi:HAD superfamily phosphatase (TIGR01668 family)|nr:HAD hydrolase-like protein [Bacilli bacterium]
MVHNLVSDYRASSVYEVDPLKIKALGFKYILMDLDNTLAPYDILLPEQRTYTLMEAYLLAGLEVILISNNTKKRTLPFSSHLSLNCLYSAHKPCKRKIDRFLKKASLSKEKTLLIGDQVINDMYLAHKLGVKGLLTDPISKKDHISAKLIRPLDTFLRNRYRKQGRLGILLEKDEKEVQQL